MVRSLLRILAVVAVIVFSVGSILQANAAPEHLVPAYADNHYQIAGAIDVITQQVCLGVEREAHGHTPDVRIEGEALVSHSFAFSQTFAGTLNMGRLTSWGYTVDRVRTLETVSYTVTDDLITIQAAAGSALNVQLRSDTCIFRFPFAYEAYPSRNYLPYVLKESE